MVTENNRMIEGNAGVGSSMTGSQIARVVVIALALWFAGAMSIKIGSTFGIFGPITSLFSFAVTLPIAWVSVLFMIKVAKLKVDQIVPGVSLGNAAAISCDGIAITWAPWLYGTDPAQISLGAAWLLWGVAMFIASAFVESYRRRS